MNSAFPILLGAVHKELVPFTTEFNNHMMNSDFTSHAGNFCNTLETQVDPRTGQFMLSFPVANLIGNQQLGPELSLSLTYSPLNSEDYGFGNGFSLGTTQFNNRTHLLQLISGESYRVMIGSDKVRDQKLDNFRFCYANGKDETDGYNVIWKDGKFEKLTKMKDDETFVTTTILSPMGRRLTLTWDWTGQFSRISKISDEKQALCEISYDLETQVKVWPETPDSFQLKFNFINDHLDEITRHVSDAEIFRWRFNYDNVGHRQNQLTLTGIDYPTGMTDRVQYNAEEGLRFPDNAGVQSKMPCVLTHIRHFGGNQPDSVTRYEYTAQNFLGYNGNFGEWAADSDYIYTTLTDYTYGSTEILESAEMTIETERTYNNYHLQITEKMTRQGNIHNTEMSYYAEKNTFIDDQPAQFKLLKEKKETFQDAGGNKRETKIVTNFDEHGNPTKQIDPDGTQTIMTWYPKNGENGCPAEPNGFVRFIKEKRVIPPKTCGSEPEYSTKYTYATLKGTSYVVQETKSSLSNATLLSKRSFEYENDSKVSEFGRITRITDTLYDSVDKSKSYATIQLVSTTVIGHQIAQTIKTTGHDGLQTSSSRIQSVFNGNVHSDFSTLGIETRYVYDDLGRLTSRKISPDSEYECTSRWEYGIDANGPYTIEADAYGNKKRTHFDGNARETSHYTFDAETAKWYETSCISHNSFGEVISGTVKDWTSSNGTDSSFPLKSDIMYGGWGEKIETQYSDGKTQVLHIDPINLTKNTHTRGGTMGRSSMTTGSIHTTLDRNNLLPITKVLQNIEGEEYSRCRYTWNGLRQMHEEYDELGGLTTRTYDAYGRVLSQTSPDGTVVTRTYAPHLTGGQIASISVTGLDAKGTTRTWLLGTQTFDSFGRLTQSTCGGRITSYSYQGASLKPFTVSLPSGKILSYTYIPELNYVVSSLTCDGITQNFRYDKKTGSLLNAREADSETINAWSLKGELKEETFSYSGKNRHANHDYTLNGAPIAYTDVTGKQMNYRLDSDGRVDRITDDSILVDVTYDALGRLQSQNVRDTKSSSMVTITRNYDDFGREISRTIKNGTSMELVLSQTWHKNNLLATRTTCRNDINLRQETYEYDCRNRLISYNVTGDSLPVDAYAQPMLAQTYRYDALNNITSLVTTLSDRSTDTAKFHYLNDNDPTQLSKVTHTHKKYPETINLSYDIEGRMTSDETGKTLAYDTLGRLISVSENNIQKGTYSYDASNRLITQNAGNNDIRQLYYNGSELVNEVIASQNREKRLIKTGHTCIGVSDGSELTLTAGDQHDSLLWSSDATKPNSDGQCYVWSPYGSGTPNDSELPGFNGERIDPVSGTYHLGNGYRAYNPVLMRFNCPDNLSPFGEGGINSYAYCAGDPINNVDPSGHISWQGIFGIVMGVVGIGLAVFTGGASIAAAGGVMAAVSSASAASLIVGAVGVVSDVTAILSGALEDVNPEASSILGWVSLGTGLIGLGAGVGGFMKNRLTSKASKLRSSRAGGAGGGGGAGASRYEISVKDGTHRTPEWHPVKNGKKVIYGSDQQVTDFHVQSCVEQIRNDMDTGKSLRKPIIVLSGTHGAPGGGNWNAAGQRLLRRIDVDFYHQDIANLSKYSDVRVFDVDATTTKDFFFHMFEKDSSAHVVLGFCFSRNEETLLELADLSVVQTYSDTFRSDIKNLKRRPPMIVPSANKPGSWAWAPWVLEYC